MLLAALVVIVLCGEIRAGSSGFVKCNTYIDVMETRGREGDRK